MVKQWCTIKWGIYVGNRVTSKCDDILQQHRAVPTGVVVFAELKINGKVHQPQTSLTVTLLVTLIPTAQFSYLS